MHLTASNALDYTLVSGKTKMAENKMTGVHATWNDNFCGNFPSTVPLETMGPFARGKTSSLPNMIAANSPWWDEKPQLRQRRKQPKAAVN